MKLRFMPNRSRFCFEPGQSHLCRLRGTADMTVVDGVVITGISPISAQGQEREAKDAGHPTYCLIAQNLRTEMRRGASPAGMRYLPAQVQNGGSYDFRMLRTLSDRPLWRLCRSVRRDDQSESEGRTDEDVKQVATPVQ